MGLRSKVKYWLRQFPFIYPRKLIYSCEDWIINQRKKNGLYFNQRGPWFKTVFDEGLIFNAAPKTQGTPNDKAFFNNRSYFTGKASLFYLQNCYLLGHKGLVLTVNHEVFQEFSHHFNITNLKKLFWQYPFFTFTKSVKEIHTIGAVLISPKSHNYYHWLSDVLPRIKLYEQVLDQIDHFCIASNVPDKFLEILPDFGIPLHKILLVNDKEKLHFDYLFVASLPGSEGRSPRWAVDYLREKLVKPGDLVSAFEKIYFKRDDNTERKILNEQSIITLLKNNGFEIIEPGKLSIYEQACLMQNAKIVISAHGAALSNLVFARCNAAIIELFSPDYFRTDCYYTLSALRKLNYWYIVGEKPSEANWGDTVIDVDILVKTLNKLDIK